jgi:cytochrome c oxidase subunit 4
MSHAHHFDESNPHGEPHAQHVIVPPITLRTVLAFLLMFTVLTVGIAQAEVWAQGYFGFEFPKWVNILVAMTIATVKSVLVMAFFMQLRYDNAMNTIVMLFCFFAVGLFLFFSGLDLFTRDWVTDFKSTYVVPGGSGPSGAKPYTAIAKDKWLEQWGPDKFERLKAASKHGHGHGHDDHAAMSSASRSRPLLGETGALSTTDAHGHDDGHKSDHGKDAHGEEKGHTSEAPQGGAPKVSH